MIKLFFTLWVLSLSFLYGQPLIIHNNFVSALSGPYQTNYEDVDKRFNSQMILKDSNLTLYPKMISPYTKSVFWSHFEIKNSADNPTIITLRNLRAGTDYIDLYLYQNGKLSQKILLGDMRSQNERTLLSLKSTAYITLAPNETITLISRFDSYGSYDLQWEISSTHYYSFINGLELTLFGVFGGILVALIFYNSLMYFNLKKPVFLMYVFHAGSLLWFQYAYNGMLYFFNIDIALITITLSTWFVPYVMMAFLGVFTILFFEFHRTNRFITYFIGLLVVLNILMALTFLSAYWNMNILLYTKYALFFSLFTLLGYFFIGVYAVRKNYSGGWYYLLGEGGYIFSLIYLSIVLAGKTPTGYLNYLVPFSILLEVLMFSMALGSWVKKLRIENDKTNQLIMDEARFTVIGKSIGMAVHQWKSPLSQLNSHIIFLKAKEFEGEPLSETVSKHIDSMSNLITHMKHSINDIYESCTDLKSFRPFPLYYAIDLSTRFLNDKITLSNVAMHINISKDTMAYGSKNALINVIMTLIDNSLAQFETVRSTSPCIDISAETTEEHILLRFVDNGGGISISPLSEIFDIDKSTKGAQGTGMGLALAKLLVEKRLNGTIKAYNTHSGVCFDIILPISTIIE